MEKFKIRFKEKNLTGNAGLMPIGNFIKQLGLIKILNKELEDTRADNRRHSLSSAILIVIMGTLAGCKHFTQLDILKNDKIIRKLFQWVKFPSLSTFARLFRLFSFKNCIALGNVEKTLREKIWDKKSVKEIILDMDSTVRGVFGKQEGAEKGFNPKKKGQRSFHPLLCFIAETKECLHNWFRTGAAYTSNGCVEFMKEVFERIPSQVEKIFVRADSGFFVGALLDILELNDCTYLIKVKLKNLVSLMESQQWEIFQAGCWVTTFQYKCSSWEKARTFKAVRFLVDVDNSGLFPIYTYEYFCYVTNREESPFECHKLYGQRATSENWIEWCKNQMACGSFLTQDFWASAALFQVCILAYNIQIWMTWLTSTSAWREEPNTFRRWFIQAPARLKKKARQQFLCLQKGFYWYREWYTIYRNIQNLKFT